MAKAKRLYIERRRKQGDYAIREQYSKHASAVARTQKKAIKKARKINPGVKPVVERVRKVGWKRKPDRWRKA